MTDKYLADEIKAFKGLEDSGLTEKQVDAIARYIDFKLNYQNEYRDIVLSDAKIEIRSDIRGHAHYENRVVVLF